jgi:subtilisin-like proprotein convertase family protein
VKGTRIFASRLGLFSVLSLVLAALCGAVLADAAPDDPAPRSPGRHLVLVPDRAGGVLGDERVVARYGSYSLVEAAGEDAERLTDAGGVRRDDMREVATAAGDVDPLLDRPSLAAKDAPDRREVLALVQFVGPPKPAWTERLRATGGRVLTYQAQNAYVVYARGAAVGRLAGLVGSDGAVRAVTALGPADKVEGRADGEARYGVTRVAGAHRSLGPGTTIGALRTESAVLSLAQVDQLAADPVVVSIERDAAPAPDDERAGAVLAGLSLPTYLGWHSGAFPGATTASFDTTIDVTDSGLGDGALPSLPDFHEGGAPAGIERVTFGGENKTNDPDLRDCAGHGTNVASAAAGYATTQDSGTYRLGLGVAPFARLWISKIFDCEGPNPDLSTGDVTDIASAASAGGAQISNNSWGLGDVGYWGAYSNRARTYDMRVRDAQPGGADQPLVEVFSAGNDGALGSGSLNAEASAKNVITVGASEGTRPGNPADGCGAAALSDNPNQIAPFSARGPTNDGRLKPDLVAPGTRITGALPGFGSPSDDELCSPAFTPAYSMASGTSQAAPQVAGAAALVRRWYLDNVPGAAEPSPSPAMTKALLLNTATDLAGGPNEEQGWGRVNVAAAFDSTPREFYDQQPVDFLETGDTAMHAFEVQDPSKPVKVTLAWTDPPGPAFGDAFVNDLDLEVADGGRTYRGNVFGGAYSRTGGAADTRNNVESVYLPPGTSGSFSVTVRGTSVGADARDDTAAIDQDFALVVSNADDQPAPQLVHDLTTISGGDGDPVLESDEQVQLSEQIRNAGVGAFAGGTAALSGGSGLTVTQGTSPYAAINDEAVGTNTTPFGLRLANAATCGADVGATLTLGGQSVPLTIPTGGLGAAQTNLSGQVPLAIPDNSATGVSSSVFVAERGRVKNVDVAIPSPGIVHTAVGDLVVDLIGPDGTTVRLLDHPGGPDNAGDNVAGTTFDDDATQTIGEAAAPYAGRFKPQNDQLSRFNGKSRRGTWTLRVRDRGKDDIGRLEAWGVTTQKALCNVDTAAPDTSLAGGPGNPTSSTAAQFALRSNDAGATFECRLDGAAYAPCGASVAFSGLALGTHSFSARAIDGSDNEDATPATYSWTVGGSQPPPVAASFVLAPREARLADALAGRYSALAACASACRASAKLSVGASTARRLGLGRRAATLGSAAKRRSGSGTTKVGLRLSRKARAALRGRRSVKATLTVTLTEGGAPLTVKRTVVLLRDAGPRRIASRGLRLWAACARSCPLRAQLTVTARAARKLGLKPGSARRYELAAGRVTATRTPQTLSVKVHRSARRALTRASRVSALLEAVGGTTPSRTARLSTTLRR